jgi:hypothetical protein
MALPPAHVLRALLVALLVLCASACGRDGVFRPEYEYEEEIYLALDGTATVNINASVASLVALRGAAFDVDPRARIDRDEVRALFGAPANDVSVTLSRRDGRRFVHASIDVEDVRRIPSVAPFAWSNYRFDRRGEVFEYRQVVGKPEGREVGDVGWTGGELVNFKMHLPSEVVFHNSPSGVERGNIIEWQQPLADRLKGAPLEIEVDLETETILYSTLILFGATALAALLTLALIVWWVSRRGRDIAPSTS